MWLINTKSLELVFKTDPSQVRYAILSHTWENEEVSFQEFREPHLARKKKGYSKIEMTCWLARKYSIDYAWVDTCCIDKSSSAELSEAINSMFRYYGLSSLCFVYLCDLVSMDGRNPPLGPGLETGPPPLFSRCRWLTRGWTLQELIAPRIVQFYDASWSYRGSKEAWSESLAQITGIDAGALSHQRQLDNYSVATRFHWASKRVTTRKEDLAYCLLGIFGVYMPLLYGESENAFLRLQEEICKMTNDMSIFAWTARPGDEQVFSGLFARSPAEFTTACTQNPYISRHDQEFAMTNKGLRFDSPILMLPHEESMSIDEYVMDLECFATNPDIAATKKTHRTLIGISLGKVPGGYARINPLLLANATSERREVMWTKAPQVIYAFRTLTQEASRLLEEELREQVVVQLKYRDPAILQAEPKPVWHPQRSIFRLRRPNSTWSDASTCFWLLHVWLREDDWSIGLDMDHLSFECLVVCTVGFNPDTSSQKAKAYVLVAEEDDMWTNGKTSFSKPAGERFTERTFDQLSIYRPELPLTEKTVAQKCQAWLGENDEIAASAIHSGNRTDAILGTKVSKLDSGNGFLIEITVSYVDRSIIVR